MFGTSLVSFNFPYPMAGEKHALEISAENKVHSADNIFICKHLS